MKGFDPDPLLPGLRDLADRLLERDLPPVALVRQRVEAPRLEGVEGRARAESARVARQSGRAPGPVAVGVGSRGIANLEAIVRAAVAGLRDAGWEPFIVPAMGSHGAATAEGQAEVLAGYGITEARVGAPVRATMDTVVAGSLEDGTPWHVDRFAHEAGALFLVARVKPHTSFRGPVESGPAKMCCIGVGKQPGARLMHDQGPAGLTRRVPQAARVAERSGLLLGALAVVENPRDETAELAGLSASDVGGPAEERLLDTARALLPRLPFDRVDVLVVDRLGKDVSGTGMDTNVINRFRIIGRAEGGKPEVTAIVALDLTEETHGNAMGIGNADFVPARLVRRVDLVATYTNAITAGSIGILRPHLPTVLACGRDAIRAAVTMCGADPADLRLAWIADTLHTEVMGVSPALLSATPGLEVLREPAPLAFDAEGELEPLQLALAG